MDCKILHVKSVPLADDARVVILIIVVKQTLNVMSDTNLGFGKMHLQSTHRKAAHDSPFTSFRQRQVIQ